MVSARIGSGRGGVRGTVTDWSQRAAEALAEIQTAAAAKVAEIQAFVVSNRGTPGGLAGLDADGDVIDSDGIKVIAGGGGGPTVEAIQDIVGAMVTAGTGISLAYNDAAGTISITATGGGGGSTDPEVVRDTIASALRVAPGSGITITTDDAGDTITVGISGLSVSQVTGLQSTLDTLAARPRIYGKNAGRTIRGRTGGRSAFYGSVTTSTPSFTATTIPQAEPFISTGLEQGVNGVKIPATMAPGWYEINCAIKYSGGSAGPRNMPIQLNGTNLFEVKTYGTGNTPVCTYRALLKAGDLITLQAYPESGSVSVVADSGSAVYLDVVRLDKPKVQPMAFGWAQAMNEPATVATQPGKNEVLSVFAGISTWADVEGGFLATDGALIPYRQNYLDRALDVAGPLIPHGQGSSTWSANLDAVAAGTYDASFTTLGTNLATQGTQTVYYRPWWEFNLDTMQPNAAKFIAAWNRAIPIIRTAFTAAARPGQTLKIVWCWSEGADPLTWYPATANVDVIGADVYAMVYGTATPSLNALVEKVTVQLSLLAHHGALKSKPIALNEFAQCAVQPGTATFQGLGDAPDVMDVFFDFFENAAVLFAGYHNFSASGVGHTLATVPNTAARVEQRRALLSRLG